MKPMNTSRFVILSLLVIVGGFSLCFAAMMALPAISQSDSASEAFWRLVDPDHTTTHDIRRIREALSPPAKADSMQPAVESSRSPSPSPSTQP
jgi:hypothetical protein